jgi:hypothetical protein
MRKWKVIPMDIHGWAIQDAAGNVVVDNIYDEEMAREIQRAVNSYEPLVEALRALEPYLSTEAQLLDAASLNEGRASGFDMASVKARAALSALAEKESAQ